MRGDAMKRIRLSTLMLLIVIVALSIALLVQTRRAAKQHASDQTLIASLRAELEAERAQLVKSNYSNMNEYNSKDGVSKDGR
jgi:Tfp pilus assembly protein PilV